MMQFAEMAADVFPHVEIIEMHHHTKKDAPSGTARRTREILADKLNKTADDIPTHSVRLPGAGAHQMVIFGSEGELLTIRHDSLNWNCFAEGALKAIRKVQTLAGLNVGLEAVL
jgi:4-hydroxy-tetrahydrodipicolinate reductase